VAQNKPANAPRTAAPTTAQAAPASPYAPAPWNSAYEQSVANARAKFNSANTGLDYQKTREDQEYGLTPGFNDYQSNPYSRAALLEQSYQRADRGSTNSYAASGQLYAGSLQNSLGVNRGNYGQGRDSLEKAYRDALQEITQKRLAAQNEENEEISNADWKRIEAAENAELEPETSPEPSASSGGGGKGKAKPKGKKAVIKTAVANNRAVGGKGKKR
jgi:hypothetical protein